MNEIELIDRAIESAKCRIYRLRANDSPSNTLAHQEKAKNQEELMEVTIKALEFYKDFIIEEPEVGTTVYCILGDQIIKEEVIFIGEESFLVDSLGDFNEFSYCRYEKEWFYNLEDAEDRLTEMLESGELYADCEPSEELVIREVEEGVYQFVDKDF